MQRADQLTEVRSHLVRLVRDVVKGPARRARDQVRGIVRGRRAAPPNGAVRAFYGHSRVPESTQIAVGGMVKVQHLESAFPNQPNAFNLLYLVSSQLPHGAVPMARFARTKGARLVWNQDGVAYPAWHGPGWQETNRPLATLLHTADYVIYQSQFCKDTADRFLGPRLGDWEILYNPVDTRVFRPRGAPSQRRGLVLLSAGTQLLRYRTEAALEVLSRLSHTVPAATLIVAGRLRWSRSEEAARSDARQLAAAMGLAERVTFLGPFTQQEAPAIYQCADILLHTKVDDPCPTVVLEAMACGLPVVHSQSGGVPELVGDEAGRGVPAVTSWNRLIQPDAGVMSELVLEIAGDLPTWSRAARGRAVRQFDVQNWLERHAGIFERLCRS